MPIRIVGPYSHRGKLRFRIQTGPGAYTWAGAGATDADARLLAEARARGLQEQVDLTVGGLLNRYLDWLRKMERKSATIVSARNLLRKLLAPLVHMESASVTLRRARERYHEFSAECATASHHVGLGRARSMWKWGMRQGLVKTNPWLQVDKLGRQRRGKFQLRIDEARRLADCLMEHVTTCDAALAILIAQFMALRVSEITSRQVRDADNDCTLLWVPDAKTPAGRRVQEIPVAIQDAIRTRIASRLPGDPLLQNQWGLKPTQKWISNRLTKYCAMAGVPRIVMHSLRGQWASIAIESGALSHTVAQQLGHANFATTQRHYATPESVEAGRQRGRLKLLTGGRK